MGGQKTRWIGCLTATMLPLAAGAQVPFTLTPAGTAPVASATVGVGTVDFIQIHSPTLSLPLRNAGVVPNSEQVEITGRILRRGDEYSIDYGSGIVCIMVPQKPGDTVRVSYRYDKSKATTGTSSAIPTLRFNLLDNGQFGLIAGLGMAERTADGHVVTSNIFGFNNSFSLGQKGTLKGLMLLSDRQKVDTNSIDAANLPGSKGTADPNSGRSKLILQGLTAQFLGGTVEANYQDVGQHFTGFSSVKAAGYDQGTVDQLQKEKGLTRFGFGLKDVGFGGLKFSDGMHTVKDGSNSVNWRNMGFKMGGLSLDWSSQHVDKGFTRFKDLGEANRDQLAKETGLGRENLTANFAQGKNTFGMNSFRVADDAGNAITRREISLKTQAIAFSMGDQSVDAGFNRIGSLTGEEQARYRLDTGLKRHWNDVTLGVFGAKATPFHFGSYSVKSSTGEFKSSDMSVGFKGLSIEHSERDIDAGFHSTGNLQPGEIDGSIGTIAKMYGPGINPTPQDRAMFIGQTGIDRSSWRFAAQPLKGWTAGYTTLRLKGATDDANVDGFSLMGKNFNLKYQHESIGGQFTELRGLMTFEQQRLGTIIGLDKTDLVFDTKIGGNKISYNQMVASTGVGDASHRALNISGKTLDLAVTSRAVDKGFTNVNQLVDPEKDVLFAMIGQKGTDAKLKWRPWKGLTVDAQSVDLTGNGLQQDHKTQNVTALWTPNKHTEIGYVYLNNKSNDPTQLLYYNNLERFTLKQDLGKNTIFRLAQEKAELAGTTNAAPGWDKIYFSLQSDLNKTTKFFTERTQTHFDDGTSQTIMTNTLSAQLSPKAGVSVSDIRTDNPGDKTDQSRRDYGVWVVLPNGMKVSYGDVRTLNGATEEETKNLSVTAGQIGNVKLDNSGYNEHYWETALNSQRTQAQSNVSLSTVKPFRFGPLSDMHMNFGFNALADRSTWQQENRVFGLSAKLGTNSLGYDYRGQMWTNGYRAIDRTFRFATDSKPNRFMVATVMYKLRTLPWDSQVMIRDYNLMFRPGKNFEFSNHLVTNPEGPAAGNVPLGNTAQAIRSNEWKLDYKRDPNFTVGMNWLELINDSNHAMNRTAGISATLFNAKGSPLKLFYGLQQNQGNVPRSAQYRYSIQFDQRPGPNQTFSFFVSNLNYGETLPTGTHRSNWTTRLDYSFRF